MKSRSYVYSKAQLIERLGLSSSTIYRLEKAGQFPARVKLSANRVGYMVDQIEAWLEARKGEGGV